MGTPETPSPEQTGAPPAAPRVQVDSDTVLPWYGAFLRALALRGTVVAACAAAGIGRTHAYRMKEQDRAFSDAWAEAMQDHADLLEIEADRRAVEGVPRKKFTSRGEPVIDPETKRQYIERDYSDQLLMFRLRGERPQKYRKLEAAAAPLVQVVVDMNDPATLAAMLAATKAQTMPYAGRLVTDPEPAGPPAEPPGPSPTPPAGP
jgi:hypothetical protein